MKSIAKLILLRGMNISRARPKIGEAILASGANNTDEALQAQSELGTVNDLIINATATMGEK